MIIRSEQYVNCTCNEFQLTRCTDRESCDSIQFLALWKI